MPSRLGAPAALLAVVLLAGCGASEPVSEATSLPSTAGPTASPGESAASSAQPPSAEPGTPGPTRTPATKEPPKPGDPTFDLVQEAPIEPGRFTSTFRITWTAPDGVASGFLVYGLTECLRYAKKFDGKPCVVRGMRIPRDKLVLLAETDGDARSAEVSWETGEIGPWPYAAILIRATNEAGDSIFTIAHSEQVCFGCVY